MHKNMGNKRELPLTFFFHSFASSSIINNIMTKMIIITMTAIIITAEDVKYEKEDDCYKYLDCYECTAKKYCGWCMIDKSSITGSPCFSLKNLLSEKSECPALVFSPFFKDTETSYNSIDGSSTFTTRKPLTCDESNALLPTTYVAPDIPRDRYIVELHGPKLGQPVPQHVALIFNIYTGSFFIPANANVKEIQNMHLCYNISLIKKNENHYHHHGNVTTSINNNVNKCIFFKEVQGIKTHLTSHLGLYTIWYWVIDIEKNGEIIQPPIISIFTRWPTRLLEAGIYLPTNESNRFPNGTTTQRELLKINKEQNSINNYIETFIYHEHKIPYIIHQIWTGGLEELIKFQNDLPSTNKRHHFLKWSKTWPKLHPTWKYYLWDLRSMREFIEINYIFFLDDYDGFDMDIKRTDFFRILILFHMGGIYIDIDFEALISMENSLISSDKFDIYLAEHVTNYEKNGIKGEWPNAWMASIKNHPLWWFLLVEYIRRKNKQPHGYVTDITGPHAFTEVIQYYRYRYPSILLHSFKPIKFYPVIPLNKTSMKLDSICIASDSCKEMYPESIATHHYAATWIPLVNDNVAFLKNFRIAYDIYDTEKNKTIANSSYVMDYKWIVKYMRNAYEYCTTCRIPYEKNSTISQHLHSILTGKVDRKYLKTILLPAILAKRRHFSSIRILSIGVALYTMQYEYDIKSMFTNKDAVEYITLEIDPKLSLLGSTDRHVIGDATKLSEYFKPNSIDVVLINGVLGWGGDKKYQTKEEVQANDLTVKVILESEKILKENGILLLGRNSRHYFTTLSKIIPIFHPITLSNNQIPSRRSFYYSDNSDHFYDVLQKNQFASMAKVPNEISLFNSLYGNVHHGVLMNTMCSVNHLIVANRAVDVLLFAGRTMLKTSGCWVIIILSNDSIVESTLTLMGLGLNTGSRIMFLNWEQGNYDVVPSCHTTDCIPAIKDANKMKILSNIVKDERWNTIHTHNVYGENGDLQKIWTYQTIFKILTKEKKQKEKLHVFVHFNKENNIGNDGNTIGYNNINKVNDINSRHINLQYKEMISAFTSTPDVDLLKESYNLSWDEIDYNQYQTLPYIKFLSYVEKNKDNSNDVLLTSCVDLVGGLSKLQESTCVEKIVGL